MPPSSPTRWRAWQALEEHFQKFHKRHLRQLFAGNGRRGERFACKGVGIYFGYSKNRVTEETIRLLVNLTDKCGLREWIAAMFNGEAINVTEKRAVLHVALPAPKNARIVVEGRDVVPEVHAVVDRTAAFSHSIRSGEWRGNTGNRQRNVINICIGGSDLGPIMAYELPRHYSQRDMTFRFCSNVDSTDCSETKHDLGLEGMRFIVCSKLFTKLEALTNAHTNRAWRLRKFGDDRAIAKHFVKASANAEEVTKSGIEPEHRLAFFGVGSGRATRWTRRSSCRP